MDVHKTAGYSHAVVIREGFDDKLLALCKGWVEAHNYLHRNGKPGMRIVGINNIHVDIRELRDKEAEEVDGKES